MSAHASPESGVKDVLLSSVSFATPPILYPHLLINQCRWSKPGDSDYKQIRTCVCGGLGTVGSCPFQLEASMESNGS